MFVSFVPKLDDASLVIRQERGTILLTPVRDEFAATATREPSGAIRLDWSAPKWGSTLSYRVYQADFQGSDVYCPPGQTWAIRCTLEADLVGQTSETSWTDPEPDARFGLQDRGGRPLRLGGGRCGRLRALTYGRAPACLTRFEGTKPLADETDLLCEPDVVVRQS